MGELCRCCGCTAASRNASDADKAPGEKRAAAAGTRLPPPVRVGTLGAHSRNHHDLSRAGTARRSASNARREPSLPIAADGPGPGPGHTSCTCALGRLQALPWAVRQVITTHSLELQNMELELQIQMRERLIFEQHELIKIQQKVLQVPLTNHCTRARAHTRTNARARAHTHTHTHTHAHTRTEPFHRSRLLEICVPAPPARAAPFRRLTASTRTRCTSLSTDRTRCSPPHTCAPGSATCASTRCDSCAGRSEGLSARLGSIAIVAPTGSLALAQPATARRTWKMPSTQHPRRHEKTLLPSNLHCSR